MCLVLLAIDADPRFRFILAANRDEFYGRESRGADFWPDHRDVLGGRDLLRGGSWLGVTRDGAVATVTNVRDPSDKRRDVRSRGVLVSDYLTSALSPDQFCDSIPDPAASVRGFNLVLTGSPSRGTTETLCCSNRGPFKRVLEPGIYGLSNAGLDSHWPKVMRGKSALKRWISSRGTADDLLEILANRETAPDIELPQTGVGINKERFLSPIFIASETYGTRASTIVAITPDDKLTFIEKLYGPEGEEGETRRFDFEISSSAGGAA